MSTFEIEGLKLLLAGALFFLVGVSAVSIIKNGRYLAGFVFILLAGAVGGARDSVVEDSCKLVQHQTNVENARIVRIVLNNGELSRSDRESIDTFDSEDIAGALSLSRQDANTVLRKVRMSVNYQVESPEISKMMPELALLPK